MKSLQRQLLLGGCQQQCANVPAGLPCCTGPIWPFPWGGWTSQYISWRSLGTCTSWWPDLGDPGSPGPRAGASGG